MTIDLLPLEGALRKKIEAEEEAHARSDQGSNTLWDHLGRVAALAESIGRAEGIDPLSCRIAGLFHDAGKFKGGRLHKGEVPEEERSVDALKELVKSHPLPQELVEQVSESIRQLYREDPDPTSLTRVLFDADNLDKLGHLGVANYFVKMGLRGRGISKDMLYHFTVELTYARHAPDCLATPKGRAMAKKRAPETLRFLRDFLSAVRDDGLFDFQIEEVLFNDLQLDVVSPKKCDCGSSLNRHIWETPGIKCSEIHMEHSCSKCGVQNKIRFCRPRLMSQLSI